jgi:hypothetical protein
VISEAHATPREEDTDTTPDEEEEAPEQEQFATHRKQLIELLSAVLLALATIATAWSGYQSPLWGGDQTSHESLAATAIIKSGLFANPAEQ